MNKSAQQLLIALALGLPLLLAAQSVPGTINYQGRLTDNTPQQNPLTATVPMQFAIYQNVSGGGPLWQEPAGAATVPVSVTGGIFNVLLGGNGAPIPALIFGGGPQRYLEITAGGEIMTPRQVISASGFAHQAQYAATALDSVQLGGVGPAGYQLATAQSCGAGQFLNVIGNGSASCAAPQANNLNPPVTLSGSAAAPGAILSADNGGGGNGLSGTAAGDGAAGVYGFGTGAGSYGVFGKATGAGGTGVTGYSPGGTGILGVSNSGDLFAGSAGATVKFRVDISGNVSATKFTGDGSGLTNLPGGNITPPVSLSAANASAIITGSNSGAGPGVSAVNTAGGPPFTAGNDGGELFRINYNGDLSTTYAGSHFNFGSQVRQMLNLWGTPDGNGTSEYGIGVQSGTEYFRTPVGGNFAWHSGGTHSDGQNDPGAGGSILMLLDSTGRMSRDPVFGSYARLGTGWGVDGFGYVGVNGTGNGFSGVSGKLAPGTNGFGIYGENSTHPSSLAGLFSGKVQINGNLQVNGTLSKSGGSFKIDHPLEPAGKFLYHSFVESPDMKNIYDGVIPMDAHGEAIIVLPQWFAALNRDFRYQLTCIGGFAPVFVAEEIAGNRFKIAGGRPGMKISWQVTGIRQDAWANAHRIPVEEAKPAEETGYYLHPELYNAPEEKGLEWARHPDQIKKRNTTPQPEQHNSRQ